VPEQRKDATRKNTQRFHVSHVEASRLTPTEEEEKEGMTIDKERDRSKELLPPYGKKRNY
jgi:hypothetical protein